MSSQGRNFLPVDRGIIPFKMEAELQAGRNTGGEER
jgi:hypothetical protein